MMYYSKWLALSLTTRQKIAAQFGIEKKGPIEVFANTVKSDGFAIMDVENILTKANLAHFVDPKAPMEWVDLFDAMVAKIEGRYVEPTSVPGMTTTNITPEVTPIKDGKTGKKKGKK